MGIPLLHKLLNEKCQKTTFPNSNTAIQNRFPISYLKNRIIVVDASIYIYKFLVDNRLVEHMTTMIHMFKKYNITPVFVFDGRPPPEKKDLMLKRLETKRLAKEEYDLYLADPTTDPAILAKLRGNSLRMTNEDIDVVKQVCDDQQVRWFQASAEADPLCAYLVNSHKAYAVLSEDMDMFAYGCPCILRHLNLEAYTVIKYNMPSILRDLDVTQEHFREILCLSGTDYNIDNKYSVFDVYEWYGRYKKATSFMKGVASTLKGRAVYQRRLKFTEWLNQYGYIQGNLEQIQRNIQMFNSAHFTDLATYALLRLQPRSDTPANGIKP
jgi:hypothetical protein